MITSIGDVLREAYKRDMISSRDGNISVRRKNNLYVTPSGIRKYIVYPENIIKYKIDLNNELWNIEANTTKPSGELELHRLLQITDFDGRRARSVVHLHPIHVIAAVYAGLDLQKIASQFPEINRFTRVGPSVKVLPPVSDELAQATLEAFTDSTNELKYDIVALANHGVVSIGNSVWDSWEHIERLDHVCKIVLASGKYNE
jgi:L-fuculose-phosphate aldolase